MSNCNSGCSTCSTSNCGERKEKQSFLKPCNSNSRIKKVIGVVSGKGGVGKSLVTSLLASAMAKKGFNTAILDADITGPSIPKVFGIKDKAFGVEEGILPAIAKNKTKIMSVNLLLEDDTEPVIWRGPVIANAVEQFWTDVFWGDIDYMFVDMPPGTGDVPLTVFQSLPIDGIIVVTSPQELVKMIVGKACKMAQMLNIPVLGLVENMSYFKCENCDKEHHIFGESKIDDIAKEYNIKAVSKLPINQEYASKCDKGIVYEIDTKELNSITSIL